VLELESHPTASTTDIAGFVIPKVGRGTVRMGGNRVKYVTPSDVGPNMCSADFYNKLGLPLPSWLVPLSLLVKVFADTVMKTMRLWKEHVADRWEELDYDARIAADPMFYGPIMAMEQDQLKRRNSSAHFHDEEMQMETAKLPPS